MPEEVFVAGVDPGLKAWLVMREASRHAKSKGNTGLTIPCDIPYKYHQYWIDVLFSLPSEDMQILSTMNELQFAQWSPKIDESRRTIPLAEFERMLFMRTLDTLPDIILAAIEHRSMAYMTRIAEKGLKLDTEIGPWGRTALMLTAMRGDLRKLQFLLEQGAQINRKDKLGLTAMHLCINPESIFHSIEIPKVLLEHKCRVNVLDKKRRTPLHYACIIGSLTLVEMLLKQEADMTVLDVHEKLAIDYTKDVSNPIALFASHYLPQLIDVILLLFSSPPFTKNSTNMPFIVLEDLSSSK